MLCFFFFQAEDGIRDLVRSRGLGDVYKRQGIAPEEGVDLGTPVTFVRNQPGLLDNVYAGLDTAVSYTHLTLPTSDLV